MKEPGREVRARDRDFGIICIVMITEALQGKVLKETEGGVRTMDQI